MCLPYTLSPNLFQLEYRKILNYWWFLSLTVISYHLHLHKLPLLICYKCIGFPTIVSLIFLAFSCSVFELLATCAWNAFPHACCVVSLTVLFKLPLSLCPTLLYLKLLSINFFSFLFPCFIFPIVPLSKIHYKW